MLFEYGDHAIAYVVFRHPEINAPIVLGHTKDAGIPNAIYLTVKALEMFKGAGLDPIEFLKRSL